MLACLALFAGSAAHVQADSATDAMAVPAILPGERAFVACAGCHSLASDAPHKVGPNLYGLRGRRAASRPDFTYSPELAASGIVWGPETLATWIVAAEHLVPGTWMLYDNVLRSAEVPALVDYILRQEDH